MEHTHAWKFERINYKDIELPLYSGNLICDCGEKIWEDEVIDVVSMNTRYSIRGNSPFPVKPSLPELITDKRIEQIVQHSTWEDWGWEDDGEEYSVQRLSESSLRVLS